MDKAEKTHIVALEAAGINYNLNPCEGAFHGLKLEVNLSKRIKCSSWGLLYKKTRSVEFKSMCRKYNEKMYAF